jgi:hypothetical protein
LRSYDHGGGKIQGKVYVGTSGGKVERKAKIRHRKGKKRREECTYIATLPVL